MQDSKAFLASVLLLVILPSSVQGCVNFQACGDLDIGADPRSLTASLYDNQEDVPICSFGGMPGSDGLYHFTCNTAGYGATFDSSTGVTFYTTPGQDALQFANNFNQGTWCWMSCQYGCSDSECFISS